jgi:hypothetical protein
MLQRLTCPKLRLRLLVPLKSNSHCRAVYNVKLAVCPGLFLCRFVLDLKPYCISCGSSLDCAGKCNHFTLTPGEDEQVEPASRSLRRDPREYLVGTIGGLAAVDEDPVALLVLVRLVVSNVGDGSCSNCLVSPIDSGLLVA